MIQKIGQVTLDDTWYPGEDLYSDGAIEDHLLSLAQDTPADAFDQVVTREKSWPVLYHFSSVRENIVRALPIGPQESVLEIGSGCGAVTGALAAMARSVTSVDLSGKRSRVNALRHRDCDNLTIYTGNFQQIEPHLPTYDWITLIGVYEYASAYIDAREPYVRFLELIRGHLNPGGRIVIAIENRLGYKYFAGCREDHTGRLFDGLEGYPHGGSARTFSRRELERLFARAHFREPAFYYPDPDYKLPTRIWSDACLPGPGQIRSVINNFDRERKVLFDEGRFCDALWEGGDFPTFSNSFLVILRQDEPAHLPWSFVKFSEGRDRPYAISTMICEESGERAVIKRALYPEGRGRLAWLPQHYERLSESLQGSGITPVPVRMEQEGARFAYIAHAGSLEDALRSLWQEGREAEAAGRLREITERIRALARRPFAMTEDFLDAFGDLPAEMVQEEVWSLPVTDVDMIPENLLLPEGQESDGDGYVLIDYEWTYEFPIPVSFVIWRMWHYFLAHLGLEEQEQTYLQEQAGISRAWAAVFAGMERRWQKRLAGEAAPVGQLHRHITPGVQDLRHLLDETRPETQLLGTLWYQEKGQAQPSALKLPYCLQGDGQFCVKLPRARLGELTSLRWDPVEGSLCRLRDVKARAKGQELWIRPINGFQKDGWEEFWTLDPAYALPETECEDMEITGTLELLAMQERLALMDEARRAGEAAQQEVLRLRGMLAKDPLYAVARKAKKLLGK